MLENKIIPVVVSDVLYDSGWMAFTGNGTPTTYWEKITDVACDVKVLKRFSNNSINENIGSNVCSFNTATNNFFYAGINLANGSVLTSSAASIYKGETWLSTTATIIDIARNNQMNSLQDLSNLISVSCPEGSTLQIRSNSILFIIGSIMEFRIVFLKPREKFL